MKPAVLNHFGLSGGKDSTALMLWGIYESGYPANSLLFSWCNTGNEHPYTEKYIMWLSAKLHRIKVIRPPLDFYDLARKKKRFPSAKARFCTEALKILPSQKFIDGLQAKGFDILLHTGVRAGESKDRAALSDREWDTLYDCEVYRPLLKWSRAEVFAFHDKYGIHPNPLYGLTPTLPWNGQPNPYYGDGVNRVGCYPCIMSRKSEIATIVRKDPERLAWLDEQERSVASGDGTQISTFFASDKTPLRYRTMRYERAKDGKVFQLCPIVSVAKWSVTGKGGHNLELPLFNAPDNFADEPLTCASKWGLCE